MLLRRYYQLVREAAALAASSADDPPRTPWSSYARSPKALSRVESVARDMERAMRFVFSEAAMLACRQLAEHPTALIRAQDQIFAPFPQTWIEMPDDRGPAGFFWVADESAPDRGLRRGGLMFVQWPPGSPMPVVIPTRLDLDRTPPLTLPDATARIMTTAKRTFVPRQPHADRVWVPSADEARAALPEMMRWMLAGWALIASHGMTHSVEADMSRLNRARVRRGLYPLLGFREIRLNLDVERIVRAHGNAIGTENMPLHPVRAHLRLLETGKVTIVRAHWRGNPDHGIRSHHYSVVRAEG